MGGKKFPVVAPVHVGDQLTLLVRSRRPREISIPEFGLIGFATRETPARFELLATTPGTFGILFAVNYRLDSATVGSMVIASTGFSIVTMAIAIAVLFSH